MPVIKAVNAALCGTFWILNPTVDNRPVAIIAMPINSNGANRSPKTSAPKIVAITGAEARAMG